MLIYRQGNCKSRWDHAGSLVLFVQGSPCSQQETEMTRKTDENAPTRVADMSTDELDELIATRREKQMDMLINMGGEVPWPMLPGWPGWPCPAVPGVPPHPPFCPNCLQQMETEPSLFRGAAFSAQMGATLPCHRARSGRSASRKSSRNCSRPCLQAAALMPGGVADLTSPRAGSGTRHKGRETDFR